MPGMPRVPGLSELIALLQAQTEAFAQLPRTLVDLNRTVLSLAELIASSRETLASTQRMSARVEQLLDELEEPIRSLRPGIERLASTLNDPVVDEVPEIIRQLRDEAIPLVQGWRETQTKVDGLASLAEETTSRLSGLPGASLLWGRRWRPAEESGDAEAADKPDEGAPDAGSY